MNNRQQKRTAYERKRKAKLHIRRKNKVAYPQNRLLRIDKLPDVTESVMAPSRLNFKGDFSQTIDFIQKIRSVARGGAVGTLRIDLRNVDEIDPAAVLVLTAEMARATFFQRRLNLKAAFPKNDVILEILHGVGFFRYFKPHPVVTSDEKRFYIQQKMGASVDRDLAIKFVDLFPSDGLGGTQRLYEALIEVMTNAHEWGYDSGRDLYKYWWALAYKDKKTNEIAYIFFDQGRTIPKTIPAKLSDFVKRLGLRGSKLIFKAMKSGNYSKTGKRFRGKGLPTMKRFIDESSSGELLVASGRSRVIYNNSKKKNLDDFDCDLPGTLICWNFVQKSFQSDKDDQPFHLS